MSSQTLEFKEVFLTFGRGGAFELKNISFSAYPGEITLLIGVSGSGKSTILSIASGLQKQDSGTVLLGNEAPKAGEVGFSFQESRSQLFADTVLEDVMFGPKATGCSSKQAKELAVESLDLVGLGEEFYPRSPFSLSGGQARLASLAGVIALEPKAFCFDEPTAGLDNFGRRRFFNILQSLLKKEVPILVVSHDLDDFLPIADRVIALDKGEISWQGDADTLINSPELLRDSNLIPPSALAFQEKLSLEQKISKPYTLDPKKLAETLRSVL